MKRDDDFLTSLRDAAMRFYCLDISRVTGREQLIRMIGARHDDADGLQKCQAPYRACRYAWRSDDMPILLDRCLLLCVEVSAAMR